jgi:hypothetical protein
MISSSGPLFTHLQKRGITIIGGVPNSKEEFDQAVSMGVDVILTDKPGLLKEYVSSK